MRIVVWGINYTPEATGIGPYNTDLAEYLAAAGHDVTALTTFPYYPAWKKRPEDRGRLFRTDRIAGVRVVRCWHYVPARPTALKRMLHEATFTLTSFLRLLAGPRPDFLFVVSPPLLLGPAAWIAARLRRCRHQVHVQDMQPDAALRLGMLKPGGFSRALYALERVGYDRAWRVSGITRGMLRLFTEKGVPGEKQQLFYNWVTSAAERGAESSRRAVSEAKPFRFRQAHGFADDAFLAVYSGNLGKKQGLGVLLDAAESLRESARQVRIVIAGDGVEKPALEEAVRQRGLSNLALLPLLPDAEYQAMLAEADVCLVTQQRGSGALFFPSKLLSILAAGRPVVTVADDDSELRLAVEEGRFGKNVPTGDAAALAGALRELAAQPGQLAAMSASARSWVAQFSREAILRAFERSLPRRET